MKTKSQKKHYVVLSGEGENGTFEHRLATDVGIKRILTRERCGGDRWASVYCYFYLGDSFQVVGVEIDTGLPNIMPSWAAKFVA